MNEAPQSAEPPQRTVDRSDQIAREAQQEQDLEQRAELAQAALSILNEDLPVLPLWYDNRTTFFSESLQEFAPGASGIAESLLTSSLTP